MLNMLDKLDFNSYFDKMFILNYERKKITTKQK